jgi:hypothetical protein
VAAKYTSAFMRAAVASAVLLAGACTHGIRDPGITPDAIETTLLLIGDAGEPDPRHRGAPLDSIVAHASEAPERTIVLFLGDNIYPAGVPVKADAPTVLDARRRLEEQVLAVPPGARGIFVAGNHDWGNVEPDGLLSIRRQGEWIAQLARGRDVRLLPANGCPGPVTVDNGRLRLVLLDTQWFLHPYVVRDSLTDCPNDVGVVTALLREQVRPTRDDQVVVVAGHHPLMTGGKHGGYCGITGPYNRFAGSAQDILSSKNRQMRDSLESAWSETPPFIYAAGHEHNLQVLRGRNVPHLLVSGAGSYSKAGCAVYMRESRFISQHRSGFMRVDIMRAGGVLLRVYHFDGGGRGGLVYTRWLEERP